METATTTSRPSIINLVRALTGDTKTFIREEVQLAKTEITEKISKMGKNAVSLAIGGFVAYAGLIVFLIALGLILMYAFEAAGLSHVMAAFLGFLIIGVLIMGIGGAFIAKAIGGFSKDSVKPERTIHTLQELRSSQRIEVETPKEEEEPEHQPSSEEMQARVEATEDRLSQTLDELGQRLSPSHINRKVKQTIRANPYKYSLIAMAAGFTSAVLLRWKLRHA
jgi:hypothetical protein